MMSRIDTRREVDGKVQTETRYFALSWTPQAEALLTTARTHWQIENALHWQLDVSFREDAARNRKDHGPSNIAILCRRALDLARRDTSKGSTALYITATSSKPATRTGASSSASDRGPRWPGTAALCGGSTASGQLPMPTQRCHFCVPIEGQY